MSQILQFLYSKLFSSPKINLDLVKSSNASLVASQPLVAVFVGGTSNIGMHAVKSLAATDGTSGKGLRAYIIGRNAKAAKEIISECQQLCPTGQFRFIQANDLALIKDVDHVSAELIKAEEKEAKAAGETPRIDILVMTQAIFNPWEPRNETTEGLDTFISLLYYSRIRFITQLLQLLLSSNLPAHIISVYGPGRDTVLIQDDLSLRSPTNYNFTNAGSHAAYFTTFFFEYLATKYAGKLSLVHYFPGLILSDGFFDPAFPWWFRAVFWYGGPVMKLFPMTLASEECGARTLFNASERFPARSVDGKVEVERVGEIGMAEASDGVVGGGAYRVNYDNEMVATGKDYGELREEGWREKVVSHTLEVFKEIEAGRVFEG